jgi:hypothetical protein
VERRKELSALSHAKGLKVIGFHMNATMQPYPPGEISKYERERARIIDGACRAAQRVAHGLSYTSNSHVSSQGSHNALSPHSDVVLAIAIICRV